MLIPLTFVAVILYGVKSRPIRAASATVVTPVNSSISNEKLGAGKDRMRDVFVNSAPQPVSPAAASKYKKRNPLPKRTRLGINISASLAE
jgi:hypothetical protein